MAVGAGVVHFYLAVGVFDGGYGEAAAFEFADQFGDEGGFAGVFPADDAEDFH